jgi:hypothetical protein
MNFVHLDKDKFMGNEDKHGRRLMINTVYFDGNGILLHLGQWYCCQSSDLTQRLKLIYLDGPPRSRIADMSC